MRLNPHKVEREGYEHLYGLAQHLGASRLEAGLRALVEIRVSQINGCAYCLRLHVDGALGHGVDQKKIDVVAAWREVDAFSERERAALGLAEAMVRIGDGHRVDEEVWSVARLTFDDADLATLCYVVGLINFWNTLNVTVEMPPES